MPVAQTGPDIFRFVDAGNAELLNLNDPSGWMLLRGFDLGITTAERTYISQPPFDGAFMSSSRRPQVTMVVPLYLTPQTDSDAMVTHFTALATELDRVTNIIEYRPQGASSSFLIDTFRADIPSFYSGFGGPSPFVLLQSVGPLVCRIDRLPDFRGAATHL